MTPGAPSPSSQYRITVQGRIDADWSEWLGGMQVIDDGQGNTILDGPVADQAALYGLLWRIRDLGLTLLAVARTE